MPEGTPDFIATDSVRTIKTVLQQHLDADKRSSDYVVFSCVLRLTVEELVENPRFYGRFGGRISYRPTIVVETGLSESLPRLRNDASWWLVKSSRLVKVAIIISISHDGPDILIETWEPRALSPNRSYALRSRGQNPQRPVKTQEIRMSRSGNARVTVGAPLTIRFFDLFLQAPAVAVEQDFVLTASGLEVVADEIWEWQGFLPLPA